MYSKMITWFHFVAHKSASPTYVYVIPYNIIQPVSLMRLTPLPVIPYIAAPLQAYVNYVPPSAGPVLQSGIYTGRPTLVGRPVQLVAMPPVLYNVARLSRP